MNKKIKKHNISKLLNLTISERLEKYDNMPLFQEKANKVNAILTEFPPTEIIREITNERIKHCFEQDLLVEQIAQQMNLPEAEVLLRLKEMGLTKPVIVSE